MALGIYEAKEFSTRLLEAVRILFDLTETARENNDSFSSIVAEWERYYLGVFNEFERSYMKSDLSATSDLLKLLPVIITHHNIHRLIEALNHELGNRKVNETLIPERVDDLIASLNRLAQEVRTMPSLLSNN